MIIGGKQFDTKNQTYVMGILNATPDSFYDGGKHNSLWMALGHAEQMVKDGADILDVGGESTRPGYTRISVAEEIDRTAGLIAAIKARLNIPVSIDTYKAAVAKAAIEAGADLVNDIWGLSGDSEMAGVIASAKTACVLGHNRKEADYSNFLSDLISDLSAILDLGKTAGIEKQRIILDPGIGFGKTHEQNLTCLREIKRFKKLGYPILIGASNKSLIGTVLNLPVTERLTGTLATTAYAAAVGASFVRVHNIKENKQVIQMIEAIQNAKN